MENTLYYVCKYTPVELLESYGYRLERLDPDLDTMECGESLAHPNFCGYGKSVLQMVEKGQIDRLFLVNCCDVCRRIYDILSVNNLPVNILSDNNLSDDVLSVKKKLDFLYLMDLPHKNGLLEQKQLQKELLKLNKFLQEKTSGDFDQGKARDLWREGISKVREGRPTGDYVVLTGAHGNASLKDQIERVTDLLVWDDTCNGNRELRSGNGGDFFADYSDALLSQKSPCMRMQFKRQEEPKGVGTICHTIKFCDYYSLQYRDLNSRQDPVLKIETDCTSQSQGQIETRLEAFAELINPQILRKASVAKFVAGIDHGPSCTNTMSLAKSESREISYGAGIDPGSSSTNAVALAKSESREIGYVAGIDSGSSSTNAVILDKNKNIVAYSVLATGAGVERSGQRAFEACLKSAGLRKKDINKIISTGYGRNNLQLSDSSITEISCHAKGARFLYPQARTVIDIGGQDSKVIILDAEGNVVNFVMNDKCAAGTGRFLENMSKALELSLEEMSALGLEWKKPVTISSTCTVFAESEVVSLIANNTELPDIINGLNQSVASKTGSLVRAANGRPPYIMTGGVSKNIGVVKALEKELGEKIFVPEEAQICGALGAALFAL
ncbi:MAG: acyl-CoA dehydratase activase [Eubacteriales bacterium]|nr:acyl-CoA dehydratase activase [Eubacteriales bacterium]